MTRRRAWHGSIGSARVHAGTDARQSGPRRSLHGARVHSRHAPFRVNARRADPRQSSRCSCCRRARRFLPSGAKSAARRRRSDRLSRGVYPNWAVWFCAPWARVTSIASAGRAPAARRITDKMPANWWLIGLIHLALPNARIIHTRRDAVDTCVSCFTTLFRTGQFWSYELGELARYYRAYAATMAHWRALLPPGVMLEIDYEDVVADLEGQARRILAHCGLDWNEACLDFHRVQRPVKTASAAQVHRPIYQSSVGRWAPLWRTPAAAARGARPGIGRGSWLATLGAVLNHFRVS